MEFSVPQEIVIDNTGGTKTITVAAINNFYIITGTATLANDCDIVTDTTPPDGTTINVFYAAGVTVGIHDMTILGTTLTAAQALLPCIITGKFMGGTLYAPVFMDFSQGGIVETMHLVANSVTFNKMAIGNRGSLLYYSTGGGIAELVAKTSGRILIGDGTDLVSVAQSGDGSFNTSGVFAITAGSIVNADINASAAIALSKMATSTAAFMIVYSALGVPTAVAITGDIAVSNTGVVTIQPASVEASMLDADTALVPYQQYLSFETGELQENEFVADFDGEIVSGEASVTTTIGATDDAEIQFKIDGVNVTNGLMSFTAGSAVGDKDSCTPSAANTFTAGQVLAMACDKATDNGGHVNCKMVVRRT